jgi:predicted TIM-barrel fold metal-dependent hydrolase
MPLTRRTFVAQSLAGLAAATTLHEKLMSAETDSPLIIDTHQHLWNLKTQKLPWLGGAPEVLKHSFTPIEYAAATQGFNVKAVYMEVDVDQAELDAEADYVLGLAKSGREQTIGATIGGRPASAGFGDYIKRHHATGYAKGVRQVLHNDGIPAGVCLADDFVRGVRQLGALGMHFDLCMRPTELSDGRKLAEKCPETRFVVDHCGNGDPKAFGKRRDGETPWHDADAWRRDIDGLATAKNVICKISGIVARAPKGWTVDDLAPCVNHCLDAFGPDRVVFGGDWPVCLLGAKLGEWIKALRQIVSNRPTADQKKLWSENAIKFYGLKV